MLEEKLSQSVIYRNDRNRTRNPFLLSKTLFIFCQVARPFARTLVWLFALGRSLLAYAWPCKLRWPKLGLQETHCGGCGILTWVLFLFAELVQHNTTVPSRYVVAE